MKGTAAQCFVSGTPLAKFTDWIPRLFTSGVAFWIVAFADGSAGLYRVQRRDVGTGDIGLLIHLLQNACLYEPGGSRPVNPQDVLPHRTTSFLQDDHFFHDFCTPTVSSAVEQSITNGYDKILQWSSGIVTEDERSPGAFSEVFWVGIDSPFLVPVDLASVATSWVAKSMDSLRSTASSPSVDITLEIRGTRKGSNIGRSEEGAAKFPSDRQTDGMVNAETPDENNDTEYSRQGASKADPLACPCHD
ncbi:hypothetical protein EDD18DRAFT_1328986, partial [Armillaria luteobubalina]